MKCISERRSERVKKFPEQCSGIRTRRADAALCANLRRLPNGKINGFGQVVGEVEGHFLRRKIQGRNRQNRLCFKGERCAGMTHHATAGAMTAAVVVVARAVGAGVLRLAGSLFVVCVAADFLGRLGMKFRRVAGILAATSPSRVCRHGKEIKQEQQSGETKFHIRGKGRKMPLEVFLKTFFNRKTAS